VDLYWLEQNASDVPREDGWLSASERARMDELHVSKRRADWRLGRWTAKRAVAAYLNLQGDPEALAEVELRPAPSGAPQVFLHGDPAPGVLSLSHSSGTGFCVVGPQHAEVGCDLERVEPRCPAFLADYFTGEERQLVTRTPAARRDQMLTLLWSAKESALKALHCGLRLDTRSFNVSPAGGLLASGEEWRRVSVVQTGGRCFNGWWRQSRDFVYTIVAERSPLRLVAVTFASPSPVCRETRSPKNGDELPGVDEALEPAAFGERILSGNLPLRREAP
jgi:4'-phosphopantetheinyl transferase